MKTLIKLLTLILGILLYLGSVHSPIYAQNDCQIYFAQLTTIPNDLSRIENWHGAGQCGQNIKIGIINNTFPNWETLLDLTNANLFKIYPPQQPLWEASSSTSRATEQILTLHTVAPRSEIYYFRLGRVEDFSQAANWMQDQDVQIIVNLVTTPTFATEDLVNIDAFMEIAASEGILWLNSAGNFGKNYYESRLDWSRWDRFGWHYFFDGADGLLPIRVVDPQQNVRIYALWDDNHAELYLSSYSDSQTLAPIDSAEHGYISAPGEGLGRLDVDMLSEQQVIYIALNDTNYFRENETLTEFRIFLVNAIVEDNIILSGNSIPTPNDHPAVLTVGSIDTLDTGLATSRFSSAGKPEILTHGYSLIEGSNEYGTSFSTIIVAGVSAVYWGQHQTQTVDNVKKFLLENTSDSILIIQPDKSWLSLWHIVVLGSLATSSLILIRVWQDRQKAISEIQNIAVQADFFPNIDSIKFTTMLPLRKNGYSRIGRYYSRLQIDVSLIPHLIAPPKVESFLTSITVSAGKEWGAGIWSLFGSKTYGIGQPVISWDEGTEKTTIYLDLRFKRATGQPLTIWFRDLKWPETPSKVQYNIKMSSIRTILYSSSTPLMTAVSANPTMPEQSNNLRIFISYRRDDSQGSAGRLYDRLKEGFSEEMIFRDVDTIAAGEDFVEAINRAVSHCDVLLAVIGKHWLTLTEKDDQGKKRRRIDNPNDFVRLEIIAALMLNKRVIPVLVDDASMPKVSLFPDQLESLARRNAIQIRNDSFNQDVNRLIAHIQK